VPQKGQFAACFGPAAAKKGFQTGAIRSLSKRRADRLKIRLELEKTPDLSRSFDVLTSQPLAEPPRSCGKGKAAAMATRIMLCLKSTSQLSRAKSDGEIQITLTMPTQ
jgi:hypothetical protein